MAEAPARVTAEIRTTNVICPSCATPAHRIRVNNIRSESFGWTAEGTGTFDDHLSCPRCGQMLSAATSAIPIELAEYACPKCSSDDSLRYRVTEITTLEDSFAFEAVIECEKCRKRGRIKQWLANVFNIKKLKLALTGVEIERVTK